MPSNNATIVAECYAHKVKEAGGKEEAVNFLDLCATVSGYGKHSKTTRNLYASAWDLYEQNYKANVMTVPQCVGNAEAVAETYACKVKETGGQEENVNFLDHCAMASGFGKNSKTTQALCTAASEVYERDHKAKVAQVKEAAPQRVAAVEAVAETYSG